MTHDVFISYSSKDALVAEALYGALEQEGTRCWIAPRDIPLAAVYADAIIDGIEASIDTMNGIIKWKQMNTTKQPGEWSFE